MAHSYVSTSPPSSPPPPRPITPHPSPESPSILEDGEIVDIAMNMQQDSPTPQEEEEARETSVETYDPIKASYEAFHKGKPEDTVMM